MAAAMPARTTSAAVQELMRAAARRIKKSPLPAQCVSLRFPVALLFVRGDRAGNGKQLADQVVASFEYWDRDTADTLDIVLAGWMKTAEGLKFSVDEFFEFQRLIAEQSKWRYSGETDLLLINFVFEPHEVAGSFELSDAIELNLEKMLAQNHINSLDGFITELAAASRAVMKKGDRDHRSSPSYEISDHVGLRRGTRGFWHATKKLLLGAYSNQVEMLENFAVRNLAIEGRVIMPVTLSREQRHDIELLMR